MEIIKNLIKNYKYVLGLVAIVIIIDLFVSFVVMGAAIDSAQHEFNQANEEKTVIQKMTEINNIRMCNAEKGLAKAKLKDYYNEKYKLASSETVEALTSESQKPCEDYPAKKEIATGKIQPQDLFYVFLTSDGTYVTQSTKQHFAANRYLATDIATGGKYLPMYAPSYQYMTSEGEVKDEARTYTVKLVDNYGTMGKTIELHWKEGTKSYNWAIGHTKEAWVKDSQIVTTGDKIGSSGGCPGDLQLNEVSTGCHVHIELRLEGNAVDYPEYLSTPHGQDLKNVKDLKNKEEKITTYLQKNASTALHDKASVFVEVGEKYKIKPEMLVCIAQAETSGAKATKGNNNVGNVGSYDRGGTIHYDSVDAGIEAIAKTLNNKYLGGYTKLSQLSRYGNKSGSIYASSASNWHSNIKKCLAYFGEVNDDYLFRS
jgi:hypothetical protein